MAEERKGAVTMRGNPITLVGPALRPGQTAPGFTAIGKGLEPVTLGQFKGKVKIISAVPSIDTPVCDAETRRFNEEAARLPGDVRILTISMDLPFAQTRWCGAAGVERVTMASDFKDRDFGPKYGVLMKENGLLARAVFVADRHDNLTHVEYVKEIAEHPDYEAALAAARRAAA